MLSVTPDRRRMLAVGVVAGAIGVALAGCSSGSNSASNDGTRVAIELTPDGCAPSPSTVSAGEATFTVTNKNASNVTEAELLKDGKVVGEKEDLSPGLSGSFSVRLDPGTYVVECPNAKVDESQLTVS